MFFAPFRSLRSLHSAKNTGYAGVMHELRNACEKMRYEVLTLSQFSVCFYQTELTRSHNQNFSIIRQNWIEFNDLLRSNKIKLGENWEKFAITKKENDHYYYQCAFPSDSHINQFEFTFIPTGNYLKFTHRGSMRMISKTINVIPDSHFEIDLKRSLIHFERYDSSFNWNHKNSVVELFVPIT